MAGYPHRDHCHHHDGHAHTPDEERGGDVKKWRAGQRAEEPQERTGRREMGEECLAGPEAALEGGEGCCSSTEVAAAGGAGDLEV